MTRALSLLIPLLAACGQEFDVHAFEAELEITPEVTDLGVVAAGSTTDFTIQAVHIDGDDVDIQAVEVLNIEGDAFSFVGELPTVEVDAIADLELSFQPQELGYHWAEVTVVSDALEDAITVMVRGQAAEAAASFFPARLDFGPVDLAETAVAEFTLSNDGQVTVQLVGIEFDRPPFRAVSGLPLQVPAGQQVAVQLSFTAADSARTIGTAWLELDVAGI